MRRVVSAGVSSPRPSAPAIREAAEPAVAEKVAAPEADYRPLGVFRYSSGKTVEVFAAEAPGFEPGEVRVVLIDAQPIHVQAQRYRLVDAAAGEFESGYIRVSDAVTRQPWDDNLPVHVDR